MKYYVTYKIDARFIAEVDADNFDHALEKAVDAFVDADFGVAKEVNGEAIIVVDEDNNLWEYKRYD